MSDEKNIQQDRVRTEVFKKLGSSTATPDLEDLIEKSYTIDRETLMQSINSNDVLSLRSYSAYFYGFSGTYRNLIHRMATIPLDRFIYTPVFSVMKNPKYQDKVDKLVHSYIRNSNVKKTCLNLRMMAIMYGAVFIYETRTDTEVVHQILPATYCRTRSTSIYGNNTVEFNMQFFDKSLNKLEPSEQTAFWKSLPPEFKKLYSNYVNKKSNCNDSRNPQWQQLSPEYAFAIKGSIDEAPLFAPLFDSILTSEDLISMDVQRIKNENFRLLIQRFLIDENTGEPYCSDEQILSSHLNLKKATADSPVSILTTGFEVSALDLKSSGSSAGEQRQYAELGNSLMSNEVGLNSGLIGNSQNLGAETAKSTLGMLSSSFRYINTQIESWYNQVINVDISSSKVMYQFQFLDMDIFNSKEYIANFKQQLDLGGSVNVYFASLGIPQYMIKDMLMYEDSLKLKDLFKPLMNSNQMGADGSSDKGRPSKEVSDKTDTTQETDQNRG